MQEMEQEKIQREADEEERKKKEVKIKEQFGDANPQWEQDKKELQDLAGQQKTAPKGAAAKAAAKAAAAGNAGNP